MNTQETEEYFMKKFQAKTPTAKCKAIFDCFALYSKAQNATALTRSKKRMEKLDDSAEINYRLACKQLSMLSESELTMYLTLLRDNMTKAFASAKEEQKLSTRMDYSMRLRHIPANLTSEQQSLRDEMVELLENYYVKDGRQM